MPREPILSTKIKFVIITSSLICVFKQKLLLLNSCFVLQLIRVQNFDYLCPYIGLSSCDQHLPNLDASFSLHGNGLLKESGLLIKAAQQAFILQWLSVELFAIFAI
jgi:hypothetical protein